jgi:AmiR/NasT family two-component response regulator
MLDAPGLTMQEGTMSAKAMPLHATSALAPRCHFSFHTDCAPSAVVTESNPALREQLVTILSEMGIEVAGDVAVPCHAQALIRSMRPDLAILDADIAARLEELANIAGEAERLGSRVLLTASVPNCHELAELVGAFPVIRKPFAAANVHRVLVQALDRP